MLVERQIGHELLQPVVFILHLPESAQLADPQMGELFLPEVDRGLADPQLPGDVTGRGAALDLPQRIGNLLLGKLRFLHGPAPPGEDRRPNLS